MGKRPAAAEKRTQPSLRLRRSRVEDFRFSCRASEIPEPEWSVRAMRSKQQAGNLPHGKL